MIFKTGFYLVVLLAATCSCVGVALKHNKTKLKFKNCDHVRESGHIKSGVYTLWMDDNTPFKVHCQHETNNSATLIQRRMNGDVSFVRPWHEYQTGFGNINSDYWAGLNSIYYLTNAQGQNSLSITMQDWNNNIRTAHYSYFKLQNSIDYTMSIGGFSGNVPDDLSYNNNMKFATFDKPDINHCALHQHAGWWYNYCSYALLNGKYYYTGNYTPSGSMYDGIYWKDWMGYGYSLKYISMTLSTS